MESDRCQPMHGTGPTISGSQRTKAISEVALELNVPPYTRIEDEGEIPPVRAGEGLSVTTSSTPSRSHLIAPELKFPIHTAFAARKSRPWKWQSMESMESHEAGFPPFPHSLEIPAGFPHSHGLDD